MIICNIITVTYIISEDKYYLHLSKCPLCGNRVLGDNTFPSNPSVGIYFSWSRVGFVWGVLSDFRAGPCLSTPLYHT